VLHVNVYRFPVHVYGIKRQAHPYKAAELACGDMVVTQLACSRAGGDYWLRGNLPRRVFTPRFHDQIISARTVPARDAAVLRIA